MSKQFFEQVAPYAVEASKKTGIPASVIMSQWALESAFGKSSLAQRANNLGGIKKSKYSIAEGSAGELNYASYKDLGQFTQDYVRVMGLGYYDNVRKAGNVEGAITALAKSPYAESGYSGGKGLLDIINNYGLLEYDGAEAKKNCLCRDCSVNPCQLKVAVMGAVSQQVRAGFLPALEAYLKKRRIS